MLVKFPDPILTTETDVFDFDNPPIPPSELSQTLIEQMHKYKGVGLAANQIGIPYRVFVIRGSEENFVLFNPTIVYYSPKLSLMDEACLSLPGGVFKIKRPEEIRVRFQTPSGAVTTQRYAGLTARIVQHEIDHLDGVPFYNRANKYYRDKGMKNVK